MIIGICGPMGSGKTTAAEFILSKIDGEYAPMAMPLKLLCKDLGWNGAKDKKGRTLLQTVGHAVRAYIHEDAWVDRWLNKYKNTKKHLVVDDIRYFNEAFMILPNRGILIKILGRNEPWLPKFLRHSSEKYYKDLPYTHIIHNTGTIEYMKNELTNILKIEGLA